MRIQIDDLTVTFRNGVTAINHADLEITNGMFGLLGENGAGKTTLMRVLTTVLKPTGGRVTLNEMLYREENYEKIQKRIGYLPQEIDLYPNLTVQECLEYMGALAGVPRQECRERMQYYLTKTSLLEHRKKKMKQLSGGMKRRVGLVQALLNEPEFLIVDEPTTGLDPEERIRIRNLLVDFSENRTVLFSTHVVEDLAATCNRLAVMKKGQFLDPEERIRIRNLLVDFSENRTVLFSTHVVEDLAATCNRLAVMKKGQFLYQGRMTDLLQKAENRVWVCTVEDEARARELERQYHVSSKQFTEGGLQLKILSEKQPTEGSYSVKPTLEDAYIYVTNQMFHR